MHGCHWVVHELLLLESAFTLCVQMTKSAISARALGPPNIVARLNKAASLPHQRQQTPRIFRRHRGRHSGGVSLILLNGLKMQARAGCEIGDELVRARREAWPRKNAAYETERHGFFGV